MTQIYDLIQSIQGTAAPKRNEQPQAGAAAPESQRSFGETLGDFLDVVNSKSTDAAQQVTDVVQGRSDNLAQAMMSMEESKLSFQLMIEIRTKLMESYQEISRMQV